MIDLHAHLLAGVDDGPTTIAEAVTMCRIAAEDGVATVVVTPHQRHELWDNQDREGLRTRLDELVAATGGSPRLVLGAEIRVDSELLAEVDALPGGSLLSLAGSRYLLLEFPTLAPGVDPFEIVHELKIAGWRPIVAHAERIPWMADDPGMLAELVRRGAHLQVTAMSVVGELGRRAYACCAFLLRENFVDFVASDAHDTTARPPRLSAAYKAIAADWGGETAARLMITNPAAVLEDRPIQKIP